MNDVVTAILGGGQGARLWPLTRDRAKPSVPLGGKFRLIDVPISNSLHAGFDRIFVLTQFNTSSLHRHITQTYRFDFFRGGFVHILAAEQTLENRDWYQGTADAVRQNIGHFADASARDVLVLSGDQLYLMDLRHFVARHRERDADVTIAVSAVPRDQARGLGILRVDGEGRITDFAEKPKEPSVLDAFAPDPGALRALGIEAPPGHLLASTGIYAFRSGVLQDLLREDGGADFGRDLIPGAVRRRRCFAWNYGGYWRDIGTIPSFLEANLDLALPLPPLNLYSADRPIYTHPRFLPGTKIHRCQVEQSILCEGSILSESRIANSIVGIRAVVRQGAELEGSILMGATLYEEEGSAPVPLGIGRDCRLRRAIVDLDARIGDGSRLLNEAGVQDADGRGWYIRGGVIVVPRGAVLPPGTEV